MIRKKTSGDISDEEFEAILKPFIDDCDDFVISYIVLEVIAYYITNSYYRGSMYEGSFLQHYNSAKDGYFVAPLYINNSKSFMQKKSRTLIRDIRNTVLFESEKLLTIIMEIKYPILSLYLKLN